MTAPSASPAAKAKAVAAQRPDAVVIGSDQVASLGSRVLDKPGDAENCRGQLTMLSGQTARFHTGCAVVANGERLVHLDTTSVTFRTLTPRRLSGTSSVRSRSIAPEGSRRRRSASRCSRPLRVAIRRP